MKTQAITTANKRRFVQTMVAATSLVTFQAYLVAPLIPDLARELGSTQKLISLAISSFAIPFGLSSFLFSLVADRLDRQRALRKLLAITSILLVVLATVHSGMMFLLIRVMIGLCSGGITQFSMSMMNDLFIRHDRGRPFGWLILAHAAGMTFGPTIGACFFPVMGWRWQFILIACWAMLIILYNAQNPLLLPIYKVPRLRFSIIRRCRLLIKSPDGRNIYPFIYLNGIFHSGLFVWVSYYFTIRFHFGDQGTGLALLLFSLPGLLMAVSIGLAIKKFGNSRMVFWGMLTVSITLIILLVNTTFWLTLIAVGILSLGYVMTLPFYTGMIDVIRNRNSRGPTLGLGFGLLFLGYGSGPVLFIYLLHFGIVPALVTLCILEVILVLFARPRQRVVSTQGIAFKSKKAHGLPKTTIRRPEISG